MAQFKVVIPFSLRGVNYKVGDIINAVIDQGVNIGDDEIYPPKNLIILPSDPLKKSTEELVYEEQLIKTYPNLRPAQTAQTSQTAQSVSEPMFGASGQVALPEQGAAQQSAAGKTILGLKMPIAIGIGVVIVAIIGFVIWKMKKK